jgi:GntR family transcriptional regulator
MLSTAPPATPLPGGRAPLYTRLRQALRERVTSGEWRPGDQLPTIRQLGELYGVSRVTVVQALDTLAHEGVLVRWQGKGIFVGQPRAAEQRIPLLSFTEETVARGAIPGSRTLCLRLEPATPGLMARFDLKPYDRVVLLERLRLVNGSPLALQQAYLPEHFVPGLVEHRDPIESLYQVLTDTYGVLPTNAFESYEPIRLTPEQARLLETQPGAPAFHVDRTTSDQHGRTIEFVSSVVRGDRYEVRLHLSRSPLARER